MDRFFSLPVPVENLVGMSMSLLLAVLLGGLVGLERELNGHPAGLRTHILVAVGSTLITLVSVRIGLSVPGKADPARLSAQIVTGIGFLGAGAIMRDGSSVRGLTTAASIWTTAAIGIAVGAGPFYGALALCTTIIVLFTLWGLHNFEAWIDQKGRRVQAMEIRLGHTAGSSGDVLGLLADRRVNMLRIRTEPDAASGGRRLALSVRLPSDINKDALLADIAAMPGVLGVDID